MMNEDDLLNQYLQLPEQLEAALAGLSEPDLDFSLGQGWTIRQYAHHVIDGEALWQMNIKVVLGNDGAFFPFTWYFTHPQDEWADIWAYARRSLEPAMVLFRANTQNLVELLRHTPGGWEHFGRVIWPGADKETHFTVRQIVEMHIRHVEGHSADIRAIRNTHNK